MMSNWEDIKWEIEWYYGKYVQIPVKSTINGFKNLWFYRKVIWRYRWYDYGYQLAVIDKMLENCEKHWGIDTHYVGDKFTLGRIRVIRKYIALYNSTDDMYEESRLFKKIMRYYSRNLERFWD